MKRWIVPLLLAFVWAGGAVAQDRKLRLAVAPVLVESGLMKYLLPRFSLKTAVGIDLVKASEADVRLGSGDGLPVILRGDQVFYVKKMVEGPKAARLVDWLGSEIGQRTITAFRHEGVQVFTGAANLAKVVPEVTFTGDIVAGEALSFRNCGRCHVIGPKNRMNGVGSTPSFALMRTFPDWQHRFEAFFTLRPHPSFTQITGVTPAFADHLPPMIVPLEISVDELDSILAFVATIEPADLGAPIVHQ
ncbi:MAG: cytochrome c [Rhodobacteraceae bacterium]|nr:cytochrome c [Paracoccaceae bacterium]